MAPARRRQHADTPMNDPEVTPRKLLVVATCLLGVTFVPYVQVTISPMMMLPMTQEFGWTRTQFAFASTFFFILGTCFLG